MNGNEDKTKPTNKPNKRLRPVKFKAGEAANGSLNPSVIKPVVPISSTMVIGRGAIQPKTPKKNINQPITPNPSAKDHARYSEINISLEIRNT